ncbi:hypothetical protein [uncultured Tateyamaria sp.]|uniref:hypothetical protein n=1 Tax=uncultured Tateyamaria sp. TaxID=455651 RepID=UPI00260CC9FE|nr:hypothetical protein [uncultured Tateyamaria sp.]
MPKDEQSPCGTLVRLDAALRDTDAWPADRLQAAWGLHDLFVSLTDQPPVDATDTVGAAFDETLGQDGRAVSPFCAALCLRDYLRTYAFAEGVTRAIQQVRARHPGRPARVLYAGTGPFASLAVLQIPHFSADEVQFTLLDIHPESDTASRQVFAALRAEDMVEARHVVDAIRWAAEDEGPFDVIVTEVMQAALKNEPQVQMTRALAPLLASDGVLVPEEISMDLVKVHPETLFGETPAPLPPAIGRAMTLTVETAKGLAFADGIAALPPLRVPDHHTCDAPLVIVTRIRTFGEIELTYGLSGLTQPIVLYDTPIPRAGDMISLAYRIGSEPKLLVAVA